MSSSEKLGNLYVIQIKKIFEQNISRDTTVNLIIV